jgi:transposase
MSLNDHSDIRRKLKILAHSKESKNVSKICRYFGFSRETFYKWKRDYQTKGKSALINSKPCPENPKLRIPAEVEEKILYLRKNYHLGQLRIVWYLKRYHDIKVSAAGVYMVLKRNDLNRLLKNQRKRSMESSFKRCDKQVPGHRIQDVKFLLFNNKMGQEIKRHQYTAIDDATRARALRITDIIIRKVR